ncbi:glutamine--fructose-6-phosphate transaminase (isomerizing) [Candidatus Dojkabacteria bacterium]|nr:glutamine--fructose-6-phosphate transaminase (isomerizing) [Candidatus Dojkabacteria bacterium]
MCGIFGYSGKGNAPEIVVNGLKRLEYRGYDSWGIAYQKKNKIVLYKKAGEIGNFTCSRIIPKAPIAIGHTRWATHGRATKLNAHPHESVDGRFVLAQNGIVENFQELKSKLISKGYKFNSETDTEIIVRLVEDNLKKSDCLLEAVRLAFLDLKGRNTIILLERDKKHIVAVRNGSPLVLGIGGDGIYFASDTLSFADQTDRVIFLNDFEMAEYDNGKLRLFDVNSGEEILYKEKKLPQNSAGIGKEGYDHYMLKEIVEQKHTVREAVQYSQSELRPLIQAIKTAKNIYVVGAGTAGFAAGQIAFFLRKYGGIHAIELKSCEAGSYRNLFSKDDIVIAVSQSGETADTIETIEFAKEKGAKIGSVVNMIGSTITRMSDYGFLSRSGPEICVASTKAFTAQISWGLLIAKAVVGKYEEAKQSIYFLSEILQKFFDQKLFIQIQEIARRMVNIEHCFVLGKGQNSNIATEGALKIKEITYKHFEGFPAGELKHGVIALIEKDTPVISIVSNDDDKADLYSAVSEVKARGAWTIGVAKSKNDLFDDSIILRDAGIADPILNVIPFQLLSYFLGVKLGNNPDKPRNLAKSVTVK